MQLKMQIKLEKMQIKWPKMQIKQQYMQIKLAEHGSKIVGWRSKYKKMLKGHFLTEMKI